jgi:hypothetical protein
MLKVREVPAVGYHHPRGAGDILHGRCGKRDEVAEPRSIGRLRVIAQRDDVIFGSHDQQRRRRDLCIFPLAGISIYAIVTGCRSLVSGKNRTGWGYPYSSRQMPRAGRDADGTSLMCVCLPRDRASGPHGAVRSAGMTISRFWILPVGPLGSTSTIHTWRGYLYAATWLLT